MCGCWQLSNFPDLSSHSAPHPGKLMRSPGPLLGAGGKFKSHSDKGTLAPALLPNHHVTPSQSPLLLSQAEFTLALPRKAHSVSHKSFHIPVVHVTCPSRPLNQILREGSPWRNTTIKNGCRHVSSSSQWLPHWLRLCYVKKILICEIKELPMMEVFFPSRYLATSGHFDSWIQKLKSKTEAYFCFKHEFHIISTACIPKLKNKCQEKAPGTDSRGPELSVMWFHCVALGHTFICFCTILHLRNLRVYFALTRMWTGQVMPGPRPQLTGWDGHVTRSIDVQKILHELRIRL